MSTFPQPWISTTSHWQGTNRGPTSLWLHNSKAELPSSADVVIVGAGMAGSALSYFLTRPGAYGQGKKVVCVEAKDVASGASGRNGGHVGPKTYFKWDLLQQPYPLGNGCSRDESTRVMQNERDNLDLVEEIVNKEKLDVDFWKGELIETHHSKEQTELSKKQYAAWLEAREAIGITQPHDTKFIDDPAEAEKLSRFKDVTSIHVRPGGSVHSHKLATALMRLAIESTASDFGFYSWTPVSGFPTETADGRWTLSTSKGDITAKEIIFCTNAHTPNFFPKDDPLHTHIQPFRGQCALITPPPTYSGAQALKHTYNMKDEAYLVTTPMGGIVLGGGLIALIREGKCKPEDSFGQIDDSGESVDPSITEYLNRYMPENFVDWGPEGYGEGLTRTWTGILSTVKDWLPLVGQVPGKKGVSLVAGFAGHGMSRIFAVARGYADTMKTGVWDEALLPRSFELTAERLQRTLEAQAEFEAKNGPDAKVVHGKIVPGSGSKAAAPTANGDKVNGHAPAKVNGHGLVHSLGEKVAAVTIQA